MVRGRIDPRRVCISCSCCTELIRAGLAGGCVIRDRDVYSGFYQKLLEMRSSG
jgi:hypothetical protein